MQPESQCWYAVYTAPRAEKKVSERFVNDNIEHYLPLQKVKRRWSDRVKEVIVPVINGYIFVKILPTEFRTILNTYGALAFVMENGRPVAIPEPQINRLKQMVDFSDEPVKFSQEPFEKGETVIISHGQMQGLIGELVKLKGKHKVLIRLECFGCALTEIPLSFLEKVKIE